MNENVEIAERISRLVLVGGYDAATIKNIISETLQDYSITKIDKTVLTNNDYVALFINSKTVEGISPKTAENYKLYLNIFFNQCDKDIKLIDTNDVRFFLTYLSNERGLKQTSIQSIINILRSFFGWLEVEDLIPSNPMDRIKSFKIDKQNSRTPLIAEELELLRNACKDYKEKAIVEFLYSTGCRVSEATQIDVSKIDFEQKTVTVVGKGNKTRILNFDTRTKLMVQEYIKNRPGGTALFCSSKKTISTPW